ncbi:MAG TPA: TauD/TfdA family dioxygenase [Caulobacteraceae bacterium]|jgi:gamma-butyrobetaine dioxygenase
MADDIETIADWRPFTTHHTLAKTHMSPDLVSVTWSDGRVSPFHFAWLRDNCPCRLCIHTLTREQTFEIIDAPEDLAAAEAGCDAGGGLVVRWSDGHAGRYEAGWLRAHAYDEASRAERNARTPKILWGAERAHALPCFDFADLQTDGPEFLAWLTAVRDLGLTLVRNAPLAQDTVIRLAQRVSFVRETNFGVRFDVESKSNPDSSAYTAINLPPHTDLPTRELQPGLQFLHCLANEAVGGDSIFVDGFALAEALRRDHPDDFAVLTTTPMEFWNKDAASDYRCSAPIIAQGGRGEVIEVRYANFLRGPIDAEAVDMPAIYRAYRQFLRLSRDPAFRVVRRLEPGDVWVFDNRRVLHARTAFDPSTGLRHLQGCYVDRDELLSRIRVVEREL